MATLQELLSRLVEHDDLTTEETAAVMDQVLTDNASPVVMGAFLAALRVKRETPDEVAGLASAMLAHAIRIEVPGRASTSSARAATARTPSTSRRWRRSLPRARASPW